MKLGEQAYFIPRTLNQVFPLVKNVSRISRGQPLSFLLDHADFRAARMHTSLLDEWTNQPILQRPQPTDADWYLAAALLVSLPGQRAASVAGFDLSLRCGDETRRMLRTGQGDVGAGGGPEFKIGR